MADLGLEFEEATVKRARRSDDESFFAPLLEDAGMELRSDGPWLMTTAAQVPPPLPNTSNCPFPAMGVFAPPSSFFKNV